MHLGGNQNNNFLEYHTASLYHECHPLVGFQVGEPVKSGVGSVTAGFSMSGSCIVQAFTSSAAPKPFPTRIAQASLLVTLLC